LRFEIEGNYTTANVGRLQNGGLNAGNTNTSPHPTATEGVKGARKTKMIVALARKLLIALWRMVTTGEVPHGVVLRQAV
jgi:hypothetical protein